MVKDADAVGRGEGRGGKWESKDATRNGTRGRPLDKEGTRRQFDRVRQPWSLQQFKIKSSIPTPVIRAFEDWEKANAPKEEKKKEEKKVEEKKKGPPRKVGRS